ncbi:MAG: single-stranded-DNA-specific exonuclease RecJ [Clostridiales Family XIII bacterium]|jgi:single-stranded-DNA-specific exonuclease|nr:single-stranded-DNA-specific exonuclease RecJ [Clostridiales Family XIII bacterium]
MIEIHPLLIEILEKRGVTKPEDIEEFLSEKPRLTHDPFLLSNMEEGVDFVLSAVNRGKKIYVYGDYDVDGITSAALLIQVLRLMTDKAVWYIPSRFDEGYGLNKEALKNIAVEGGEVVITVDCGSVSFEEVEYGKSLGLEIMVTDHHSTDGTVADCILINPKQAGETYPFDGLAGCGVAFKLAQALQRRAGLPKSILNDVLDLVGIATVADIVPLIDENRTITKYGLRAASNTKRAGLRGLIRKIGLDEHDISSENVAYGIAPHINAAGRMAEARDVVELMLTDDADRIEQLTEELSALNDMRKTVQEEVFRMCCDIVEKDSPDNKFNIVNAGDAHEGITGIVAGKLREKYNRPAIVLTESKSADGRVFLKGTGRSIPGLDLFKMLKNFDGMFEKFGGHAMACGFLISAELEGGFREGLLREAERFFAENPGICAGHAAPDVKAAPSDLTVDFVKDMKQIGPFGNGNPAPMFALEGVFADRVYFMGDQCQHVRFSAEGLQCVLFRYADDYKDIITAGEPITIYGSPSIDNWNGREKVQLIVESVELAASGN